jgi:integrase
MARLGRKDRGLLPKKDAEGRILGWIVRLWHEGRERRFGAFETKSLARDFYEKAKQEQTMGRFFPERYRRQSQTEPIQQILDDYLVTTTGKRSVSRERDFKRWWAEWFKGKTTTALEPAEIEKARIALLRGDRYVKSDGGRMVQEEGKPRSNATVNRYTDWLRHVLNWAMKQKRTTENPVLAIERKPEDEAPAYQYSLEQEAAIAKELNEEEVDMVRLAVLTGLRQGEQCRSRKDHINLGLSIAIIPRAKNRKPRIVHLSEEAKEVLRRQMARHLESPWLYPGKRNPARPLNPRRWYTLRFKPACLKAGIPLEQTRQLWHRLRHTFGSRLASLGYSEKAIMSAGGWVSSKAAQRYIHLYDGAMKEAVERLSGLKPSPTVTETGNTATLQTDSPSQVIDSQNVAP